MNKFVKALIMIFIVAVVIEIASYVAYSLKWNEAIKTQWDNGNKVVLKYTKPVPFSPTATAYVWHNRFFEKQSGKKPLAVVGCSFAEGSCLEDNQILGYKLSDLSNRSVFQRGVTATGLAYVYYQIANKLLPTDNLQPEYIIYVFIFDHLFRLYQHQLGFWSTELNLRYEYKNGEIREVKEFLPIKNMFYSTKLFQEYFSNKQGEKETNDYTLFKYLMKDMMKQLHKNYPDTKIVFIDYPQSDEDWCLLSDEIKQFIKDEGYIYVNANELVGDNLGKREYKVEGEWLHPNEKAWNLVAPKLAKVLNL